MVVGYPIAAILNRRPPPVTSAFTHTIRLFLLLAASALAACGGGSAAAPTNTSVHVPATTTSGAPPAFTLTPTAIRSFRFSWDDTPDETGYRLLEDPDGASGYSPIAELPANSTLHDHEVFLPERVNARYRLQVCKHQDCVDAAELGASGNLASAVGYLKASDPADQDLFGSALALSANGHYLAIGAPGAGASNSTSGAVYVFVRDGTTWRQQALLEASAAHQGDQFGASVALSSEGDTLAVGAPQESSVLPVSGAAFVFTRSGGSWGPPVRVVPLNTGMGDRFGGRVALSADGNTLAAGAEDESSDANTINGPDNDNLKQSGAAYIFDRVGGVWTQQAYIKAFSPDAFDNFGRALALSADGLTLAVGAPGESSASTGVGGNPDDDTAAASGAVYVFGRTPGGWGPQAYVKASNTRGATRFGGAIALSGNGTVMAVGSANESSGATGIDGAQDDATADRSGAVYVFAREGAQWHQQSYVKASNAEAGDLFGTSVALSDNGETLVVGAPGEDSAARGLQGDQGNNDASYSGAVYVLRHTAVGWRQQAYVKPSNTARGDVSGFGQALGLSSGAGGVSPPDPGLALAVACPSASNATSGMGGDQTDRSGSDVGAVYLY